MEFSRDLARVTHTFEFINAVAYLSSQYPHHKVDTLVDLLNIEYYKKERKGQTIRPMDVWLALRVISGVQPEWPEGLLFFSALNGLPYTREEYTDINKPNFKTITQLAKVMRKAVEYRINALSVVSDTLAAIDTIPQAGSNQTLAYWKDNRDTRYSLVINTVRNLLVDGRRFRRFWEMQFWFLPKSERYPIPLLLKRIDVSGKPNAVKVYVTTRKHKLCICTRNSYLLTGI